jgi:Flp pilus assembly protein TadG
VEHDQAKSRDGKSRRRGALTVEMAICAPVVFLLLLGTLEFSRMNMLRNSIDNAAYEGARRGVVPGAKASDCIAKANTVLNAVGLRNASVTVTPSTITDATPQITVAISAPMSSNSWGPARFLGDVTLRSVSTKSREFVGQLVPTSVP